MPPDTGRFHLPHRRERPPPRGRRGCGNMNAPGQKLGGRQEEDHTAHKDLLEEGAPEWEIQLTDSRGHLWESHAAERPRPISISTDPPKPNELIVEAPKGVRYNDKVAATLKV